MASGGWAGSTRRETLPKSWWQLRAQVLRRDQHICQIRSAVCIHHATEVDHIGDRNLHEEFNLRAACRPCHAIRSSAQGGAAAGRAARARAAMRTRKPERHPGLAE